MIAVSQVARVLGGKTVFKHRIRSAAQLERAVEQGFPKATLRATVGYVLTDARDARAFEAELVPLATFKRRKHTLEPGEGEKIERIARVIATAEHVWGEREKARQFLLTPHNLLEDRRPLDVALTELGARRVEETLWQLFHGLPV